MKSFLILIVFALFTTIQVKAQSNVEVINPTIQMVLNNVELIKTESNNNITGKKTDRLNAKINAKLKGEVELFLVSDNNEIC